MIDIYFYKNTICPICNSNLETFLNCIRCSNCNSKCNKTIFAFSITPSTYEISLDGEIVLLSGQSSYTVIYNSLINKTLFSSSSFTNLAPPHIVNAETIINKYKKLQIFI